MKYAILIYEDERHWAGMSEAEAGAAIGEYNAYTKALIDSGIMRGGEQLHPVAKAKTVRVRGGTRSHTDGPFAETKEQLGGFYLVECATEAEALDWAAKCPGAKSGSLEVRPIVPNPG